MPKVMAHFTDMARRQVNADVVAAVPANPNSPDVDVDGWSLAISPGSSNSYLAPDHLLFYADRVDVHRMRWPHRLMTNRRIGRLRLSTPLDSVRYGRTAFGLETLLEIGEHRFYIHAWFERELRSVLRTLGHTEGLEKLT